MNWSSFLASGTGRPVRPLLTEALAARSDRTPGTAIDLGAGDGTESRFLAVNGWTVYAYDGAIGTEERVPAGLNTSPTDASARLHTTRLDFEAITTLPSSDLMYAGRSLPFCAEAAFPELWNVILASIKPDGWFVGDFFGPNDSWVGRSTMNFQGRSDITELLAGFTIDKLAEAEGPASTPFGDKHLHILSVIAHR
ncbi:class I SAM-dependent methyltransferase [Rathayibacter soli]|uniref:class I SAM-dependent methyltransferase n=1 Tax=Rathayibacter soli TaxID=3144168 RepID=UPI0027E568F2|nr:class I SAM-dependent methyltransferase [Glaciibacter superstes]